MSHTNDPKKLRGWIKKAKALMRKLSRLPKNNRTFATFACAGAWHKNRDFQKKLIEFTIERDVETATGLICGEIGVYRTKRFRLSTILKWLDRLIDLHYNEGVGSAAKVLEVLRQRKVVVSREKILEYSEKLNSRSMLRTLGNLLLSHQLHLDPSISNEQVWLWVEAAAKDSDHAIARMWPIFLIRSRINCPYPKKQWIKAMATALHLAYTERRSDRDFIVEIMLECAYEYLRFRSYKSLLYQYRKMLKKTFEENEKALSFGNRAPRFKN
ncbi:MAG: hypothetical protein V4664_04135 [Patescibacteria group bacterium]